MPGIRLTGSCEICIQRVGTEKTQQKTELVWMCPQCSDYIEELPEELCEEIERYLIGNVL